MARSMTTPPNRRGLAVSSVLVWMLVWPSLSTATTATPSATETPTPAACPVATPEPFWVDPVTSPTDQFFQAITVHIGNGQRVEVITESGVYVIEDFSTSGTVRVDVRLYPSTTTHLEVVAYVRVIEGPAGCTYGGYSLRTTVDKFGAPLTIVQQGVPPTPTPVVVDVSPFSEFHFERRSALGFCPPLDAVFSASIQARVGSYQLEMSVLQAGQRGTDACVPGCCAATECAVAVSQPPRDMTDAESARMRALFSRQRMYFEPDPTCEFIVYDPCLINQARWDALTVDDYPCTTGRRIDAAQVETLTAFLEGLRPDRTPPPTLTPTPTIEQPTRLPTPTFLPEPLLVFALAVAPPHPVVGDGVTLTFSVGNTQGFAGQPGYGLIGARPYFDGDTSIKGHTLVLGGDTLVFDLHAARAGVAALQLSVIYEVCIGSPLGTQPCFRGGTTSAVFPVEVGDQTPTRIPSLTPTPTPTATPTPPPGACVGDCNGDGEVTTNELVAMVNVALENAPLTACSVGDANADAQITVDEIIVAMNNALNRCPGPPPPRTITPTPMRTPSVTRTQTGSA